MRKIRKITRDKKGIDTILAALLMVVIVVVAAVMVYAWATGLLSSLLVQNPVPKETLTMENFGINGTVASISIRNTGSVATGLVTYYVKDSSGNQWSYTSWAGPSIQPSAVGTAYIGVGPTKCPSPCTYTGSQTAVFYTGGGTSNYYATGNSYTVTVVTSRSNQFVFNVNR